jgi:transcription antitermination factor NusG
MERWYLMHTKPSRERHVAVQLHQRGFGVYLPLIWVSPVNPRTSRERPYFPNHLFAKLDLESVGADVIRWSPGVKGLVEFSGEPVAISDSFVAELEQCLNRVRAVGGMGFDGARSADFRPMSQGPFEGYEGIFNPRLLGADRARILLACVEREFWRQTKLARPAVGMPDDPAAPRPSG